MNTPDNIQAPIPEVQGQEANGQEKTTEASLPETGPQTMGQSVPSASTGDDANIANISQALKPDPKGTTTPSDPQAGARQVKKPSSEPYIKAAEDLMQKDKGDPYREEEDHENVQTQYLKDRFGKDIKKK